MQLTAFLSDAGVLKLAGFCILACVASCNCLQCYVCGDADGRRCDDYDSSNQHLFIKDCPSGSESCINKTNANSVVLSRTCETLRVDACQVFQEFQYCYCYENLCNGIYGARQSFPNDDEDIDEGSGMEERKINPTTSVPTKFDVSSSSDALQKRNPVLAIIFCVAFFV